MAIFGDDDRHLVGKGKPNSGRVQATEAAQSVSGTAHFPHFTGDADDNSTDYNDVHRQQGLAAVQRQVEMALAHCRGIVSARQKEKEDKKPIVHSEYERD